MLQNGERKWYNSSNERGKRDNMPIVLEQVKRLDVYDKMRLMEYLVKTLSTTIVRYEGASSRKCRRRIGAMAGRWPDYSYERDREMDEEIVADCDMFKDGVL